jgi:hypothetical protein
VVFLYSLFSIIRGGDNVKVVKVRVLKTYKDVMLKEIKEPGDTFEVTKERAEHLVKQKMVEIVIEETKKVGKSTKKSTKKAVVEEG